MTLARLDEALTTELQQLADEGRSKAPERVIRGRIDAVFADADGGYTVLDWKTGDPPSTPEAMRNKAIQLAVYRLAWSSIQGVPVDSVRAVFHYVRAGQTVAPTDLPGADELAALVHLG